MAMNKGSAFAETSSVGSSRDNQIHTFMGTNYDAILDDLCSKIEGASYYSGSSSSWFLRGALGKYENYKNINLIPSGKDTFSPRGLTDVLLEKLLLKEVNDDQLDTEQEKKEEHGIENDRQVDPDHENYFTVAKALACDSSTYLPALADSLSRLVSSTATSSKSLSSRKILASIVPSNRTRMKNTRLSISEDFLKLWVDKIVDDSTPENIYEQLSKDLFRVFEEQHKLRNSNDPLILQTLAFSYLVQGDSWHCIHQQTKKAQFKSLSPPSTQATLRRASLLLRFLSRIDDSPATNSETKQIVLLNAGATEWLIELLKGEGYPTRYKKQRREASFGLLNMLLEEFKNSNNGPIQTSTTTNWLFSSNLAESLSYFFKETIRELVEDWNQHQRALPISQIEKLTTTPPPGALKSRTNRDIVSGENRSTLDCATLYIKFIARLPPNVCPYSSFDVVEEASRGCDPSGKDLLAVMLRRQESQLQRLRLVRLLIDEFSGNRVANLEGDNEHIASRKEWISSPGILTTILEECSRDPFLSSSDVTKQFLSTYSDPSLRLDFSNTVKPREAPKAIPIEQLEAKKAQMLERTDTSLKLSSAIPHWLSATTRERGEKVMSSLRNKLGDRWFGNSSLQNEQYDLFSEGDGASHKWMPKSTQNEYNIFDK